MQNKIKNLKKEYRMVKDHNEETGRGSKTCTYYSEINYIPGHRPALFPASLVDTGSSTSNSTDQAGHYCRKINQWYCNNPTTCTLLLIVYCLFYA